jgi:hypothetical protein
LPPTVAAILCFGEDYAPTYFVLVDCHPYPGGNPHLG